MQLEWKNKNKTKGHKRVAGDAAQRLIDLLFRLNISRQTHYHIDVGRLPRQFRGWANVLIQLNLFMAGWLKGLLTLTF